MRINGNVKKFFLAVFICTLLTTLVSGCLDKNSQQDPTGEEAYITITCEKAYEMKIEGKLDGNFEDRIPDKGIILDRTAIPLKKGDTVLQLLLRSCKERKIPTSYQGDTSYGTTYVDGINNLFEKDCGKKSGWMYKVDGKFPMMGTDKYKLKGGEEIQFIYTCNNGKDIGAKLETDKK